MTASLSARAAAIYLGISRRTLRHWRNVGTGPPWLRISRKLVLYRISDLDAFIENYRKTVITSPDPIGPEVFDPNDHGRPRRRCDQCRRLFTPAKSFNRFCHANCRTAWHNARHPEWRRRIRKNRKQLELDFQCPGVGTTVPAAADPVP